MQQDCEERLDEAEVIRLRGRLLENLVDEDAAVDAYRKAMELGEHQCARLFRCWQRRTWRKLIPTLGRRAGPGRASTLSRTVRRERRLPRCDAGRRGAQSAALTLWVYNDVGPDTQPCSIVVPGTDGDDGSLRISQRQLTLAGHQPTSLIAKHHASKI